MKLLILIVAFGLVSCAMAPNHPDYPLTVNDISTVTYTYTDLDSNKEILWSRARDYLALAYGDSRRVIRVKDQNDGIIIGRGLVEWRMLSSNILSPKCDSEYDIKFIAKDNKARLQLSLLPNNSLTSKCGNWKYPSRSGYKSIISNFDSMSKQLNKSLKGESDLGNLKDF